MLNKKTTKLSNKKTIKLSNKKTIRMSNKRIINNKVRNNKEILSREMIDKKCSKMMRFNRLQRVCI